MDLDNGNPLQQKNTAAASPATYRHKLSCDLCRQRKIKCDREVPCGPCTQKDLLCSYPAGFKPRQRKQRVIVSNDYEHKLDEISNKLDSLFLALGGDGKPHPTIPLRTTVSTLHSSHGNDQDSPTTSDDEQDPGLTEQAAYATTFALQLVEKDRTLPIPHDVATRLDELQRLVSSSESRKPAPKARAVSTETAGEVLHKPPMESCIAVLQRLRNSPQLRFVWCSGIESVSQFMDYFMDVYSGDPSLAESIIVYAGLERLFMECSNSETDSDLKTEFQSLSALCRKNLRLVVARLPFNLPASFDYILALLMAGEFFIEQFQLSRGSNYIAAAALMCQTLGYHRAIPKPTSFPVTEGRRLYLFWSVYTYENHMSLRLDRPSLFRDGDVTISMDLPLNSFTEFCHSAFSKCIRMSRLQSKMYNDLFNPSSFALPIDERIRRARSLAEEVNVLCATSLTEETFQNNGLRQLFDDTVYDILQEADKVSNLSILTLIYRAIPPSPGSGSAFGQECLASAQECLEAQKACISLLKRSEDRLVELYVQWAVVGSPFVPFFVVFCHAIETSDTTQLEPLATVVELLRMLPLNVPEAYRKQLRLYNLMYDFACRYIESHPPQESQMPQGFNTPFNMFVNELQLYNPGGLRPNMFLEPQTQFSQLGETVPTSTSLGLSTGGENSELQSWFDQSQQLFMMLERDL